MISQIIATFLPSILGLKMYDKLKKTEEKIEKNIQRYLIYVLFVNLIMYVVTIYIFRNQELVFTPVFTIKYILLSIVVALILPIIEKIVKDNIDIGVKVEKNEDKD